ncbi:MAG: metal-independent alpha-mannosidase [Herbinix sp.]|jgi:meiotically up-regulated gene 157 (Mug157) protein|nr:metal-independent alpha-mannosidase [Herbinix sp.]
MLQKTPNILQEIGENLEAFYQENYPNLAPLVKQCFLNTIETTVKQLEDDSYFVITGDIPAMWLRDSSAQLRPYVKYTKQDSYLKEIIKRVILKQAELVCIDPYANAFNQSASGEGHRDETEWNDHVWERKYEVDSLCAPLYLAYRYWKETASTDVFNETFRIMLRKILRVFRVEQDHTKSDYRFQRFHCAETDTLPQDGLGNPVLPTGMTWSGFRPSDDRCIYGYLIPANMMAVMALKYGEEICREVYGDTMLEKECHELSVEIEQGIQSHAIVEHPVYGKIYAYETDGAGHYTMMDDANSPSLLAIPYLEYRTGSDEIYKNTRAFILSEDNPYYYSGTYAKGIGSPHTPEGYVWHIGLIMQALTSNDRDEILSCLDMISKTHAGCNFMHESFDPNQPENYSRSWFAWANTLFAELMEKLMLEGFWDK